MRQCVASINRVHPQLLAHTYILDDASPMKLPDFQIKVLRKSANTTYSENVNKGLTMARELGYEYALLLNNDVELKTQFVTQSLMLFRKYPKLGVIGGLLYFPDGRIQHNGFSVTPEKAIQHPGYGQFSTSFDVGPSRFCMGVTGAYQILRLPLVGYYPVDYPLSYEDVAFCLRLWERDIQTYYLHTIGGVHSESATRGYGLGTKEYQSLIQFRDDHFDFPLIQKRVGQASE